ncbi:MAG: lipoyl(octanoyl) transferase LipB [Chloroflexota bacterium]|nr:lipoyl(octanoyl) transferase LipB [Chloroflexota bacterium]
MTSAAAAGGSVLAAPIVTLVQDAIQDVRGASESPSEPGSTEKSIERVWLPPAPYAVIWEWQCQRAAAVAQGAAPEALALVEHRPVYTMGRRADPGHLLRSEAELRALGAEVCWIDRGGDVTWHGPGQLTGYPILDLQHRGRDLHAYVFALEELIIRLAAGYGITAQRAAGRPGVWVGDEKLAAIGIKVVRGWVSYHGWAINVDPDLHWFEWIVPCGLHGCGVTSLARLLGCRVTVADVADRMTALFEERFGPVARAEGEARLTPAVP